MGGKRQRKWVSIPEGRKRQRKCVSIPEGLVYEILSRLPPKSVGRFRCVCKSWERITSEPGFVDVHRRRSRTSLLVSVRDRPRGERRLFSISDGKACKVPGLFHRSTSQSVNGILCIFHQFCKTSSAMSYKASVCNPSTGELVQLPRSPSAVDAWFRGDIQHLSLGFDPCSNTYKILKAWLRSDSPHRREILTLGTHAWRNIECSSQYQWRSEEWRSKEIYLDGTIYWPEPRLDVKADAGDDVKAFMTAFEVGGEKFRYIPLPPGAAEWDAESLSCVGMGGRMAIAVYHHRAFTVEIWKLEDSITGVWSQKRIQLQQLRAEGGRLTDKWLGRGCIVSGEGCELGLIPRGILRELYVVHFDAGHKWKEHIKVAGESLPPRMYWDFVRCHIIFPLYIDDDDHIVLEHAPSLVSLKGFNVI